jgi:hypothetical protein
MEMQVTGTAGTTGHGRNSMYTTANGAPPPRSWLERFLIRRWEYRYPRAWLTFRLIAGTWNFFLGCLLLTYGFVWIGLIPLAGSALIFWSAYRIWIRVHG